MPSQPTIPPHQKYGKYDQGVWKPWVSPNTALLTMLFLWGVTLDGGGKLISHEYTVLNLQLWAMKTRAPGWLEGTGGDEILPSFVPGIMNHKP